MNLPVELQLIFSLIFVLIAFCVYYLTRPLVMPIMYHLDVRLTRVSIRTAHDLHRALVILLLLVHLLLIALH